MPGRMSCRSMNLTCRRARRKRVCLALGGSTARREEGGVFGLRAITRALEGVCGVTAVHICFGYAAIIHVRPSGYSFLPELQNCACRQISIETAQSNLDCSVLTELAGKTIMLGVIDLSDMQVETPFTVAA